MRSNSLRRVAFTVILATGTALTAGSAQAAVINLVTNGDFEQTTLTGSSLITNQVTGWSTTGYDFLFTPGTADTTGAANPNNPPLKLWGPGDGSANGLTATSPSGGNFIAADGLFQSSPLSQTINGLTPGQSYTLSFEYAAGQQSGFMGATTETWTATLGGQSFTAPTLSTVSEGFSPWTVATTSFTASAATEVLSFLAGGTPAGAPPFSLLDGVSLTTTTSSVPEPATWALLVGGFTVAAFAVSRRRDAQPLG